MKTLTVALYAEGPTDYRFLPVIFQRTAERILCNSRASDVEVLEPILLGKVIGDTEEEKVLKAAEKAYGMHALAIHFDADYSNITRTLQNRFNKGLQAVISTHLIVCKDLIPIIPVRNIEAWLLCDYDAFCRVVGTRLTANELGIPNQPKMVENLSDPKQVYRNAVRKALQVRGKSGNPGDYYERLGREISLDNLAILPAFQVFSQYLEVVLKRLNFIL